MNTNPLKQQASLQLIPDVEYCNHAGVSLFLDILCPQPTPSKRIPAVVYLHGGGWMSGDKRTTIANHSLDFLANHGFFIVSVNYRLSHEAIFPAQLEDAKAAIRWLRAYATEYLIDPERIGVWGFSSGGHLAALLGTTGDEFGFVSDHYPQYSSAVQAVVAMGTPVDFLQMGGSHDAIDSPESKLVGGAIHERQELVRQANPITYINNSTPPPFLIVHGDRDELVPVKQAELLYRSLKAVGGDAKLVRVQDANHQLWQAGQPYPGDDSDFFVEIEQCILMFFQTHLQGSSRSLDQGIMTLKTNER